MTRTENKSVKNPSNEDFVFLNAIYLKTFTAMDQLSMESFDVEHIAPKAQIQKMIEKTKMEGLPISSIANLCYLPQSANRSKGSKNFYQDSKYLKQTGINIDDLETKYSFTTQNDLEWMDLPFDDSSEASVLKEYFEEFCVNRFSILKNKFCESLGITMAIAEEHTFSADTNVIINANQLSIKKVSSVKEKCMIRFAQTSNLQLNQKKGKFYTTTDKTKGFVAFYSKAYRQGNRDKFWYSFRAYDDIDDVDEVYYVFGCQDESTLIVIPRQEMLCQADRLNFSIDEEGMPVHWHVIFFKDTNGHMTWLLSKPNTEEVSIDKYKV